jgi:hypothetical protein
MPKVLSLAVREVGRLFEDNLIGQVPEGVSDAGGDRMCASKITSAERCFNVRCRLFTLELAAPQHACCALPETSSTRETGIEIPAWRKKNDQV